MNKNDEKMVKVKVNGTIYDSARAAARYIVGMEPEKNVDTIRKEIQRFLHGKRDTWSMYGKYRIHH